MPIFRQVAAVECPNYQRVVHLALPPFKNLNAWDVHYVKPADFRRFNRQNDSFLDAGIETDIDRIRTERALRAAVRDTENFPANMPSLIYEENGGFREIISPRESPRMIKFLIDGGASVFPLCVYSESCSSDFIGQRLGAVRKPQPAYSWQRKLKHKPGTRHGLTPALTDSYAVSDIAAHIEHVTACAAGLAQNCHELEQKAQAAKPADFNSVMREAMKYNEDGRDPHYIAGLRYNQPDVIEYLELHAEIRELKNSLSSFRTLKALQTILDQMVAAGLTHAHLSNPHAYRSMLEDLALWVRVAERRINQPEGSDFELIDRFEATANRYYARKFEQSQGHAAKEEVDRLKRYLAPLAAALHAHVDMELIGANISPENLDLFADILTEPQHGDRPMSLVSLLSMIRAGTNAPHPAAPSQ